MPANPSGRTWILLILLTLSMGTMAVLAARPAAWEGFVAAGFAGGVLTVLIWRRKDVPFQLVIVAALAFRLFVFWLPPVLSDDAYRYVWDGVVQAEGHNPYLVTPDDPELAHLRDEPIYDALNSSEYYTVYPPVSQLIFRFAALFYEHGWTVSYFVIKAALALLEFGAVLVLARMLRPEQLILYAWNPLVVIAAAGQAHGEAAAAFFLSLVLLALYQGRGTRASVWLACAGWVKLYPFVLFPFLWRRYGWRSAAAGCAATAVLAAPYVHADVLPNVMQSLDLYVRYFEFNAGPYYTLKEAFRLFTGQDWSKQLGPALRLCFLASLPVLYALDWKRNWPPGKALAVTVGLFLLCATTIHPWYLLGMLVLLAPAPHPFWHWYWLSVVSIGTYLLYVGGPYWSWVILGWSGFVVLAALRYRQALTLPLLRYRAKEKAELLTPVLGRGWSVLDVGAGEGYVGRILVERLDADVRLVDTVDMNQTALPHRRYDGRRLPFPARSFDASTLVYVLHHAADAEAVLLETLRVSRRRVVVIESTYRHAWERPLLICLDRAANSLRSSGESATSRESLHLRTHAEWLATFSRMDLRLEFSKDLGGFIHHRSLFVLAAAEAPSAGDASAAGNLPGASGNPAAA